MTPPSHADSTRYPSRRRMSFVSRRTTLGQTVLLKVVAELPERHPQQLGGLGLNATCTIEGPLQVAPLQVVECRLEIQALLGNFDELGPPGGALASHGLGQGVGAEHVPGPEDDGALEHVLQLLDIGGPMVTLPDREPLRRDSPDVLAEMPLELLQEVPA